MIVTLEQIKLEVKNELQGYQKAKRLEAYYKRRIEEICSYKITSSPNPNKVQTQNTEWEAERIADKLNEFYKKYYEAIDEVFTELQRIENNINSIDAPYCDILRMRYIENQRFEKIALDLHYDYDWIFKKHMKALEEYFKFKNGLNTKTHRQTQI